MNQIKKRIGKPKKKKKKKKKGERRGEEDIHATWQECGIAQFCWALK